MVVHQVLPGVHRGQRTDEFDPGNSTAKVADVRLKSPGGHVTEYSGVFVYELDDTGLIQTLSGYFTFPGLG